MKLIIIREKLEEEKDITNELIFIYIYSFLVGRLQKEKAL